MNPKYTPVTDTLGKGKDKAVFNERFNYRSIIGMLMYLGNTTCPDITFAINQCARFSHDPWEIHATALKRIGCYLKATCNKGILWKKGTENPMLDCWVDADFAGLYSKESHDDPMSVRSRTGFVITLGAMLSCGRANYKPKLPCLQCQQSILLCPLQCGH